MFEKVQAILAAFDDLGKSPSIQGDMETRVRFAALRAMVVTLQVDILAEKAKPGEFILPSS